MKFHIVIREDESGGFVVNCPSLPGCWSQGETRDEAVQNITEAIEGYLESLEKAGDPLPLPLTDEIVEVPVPKRRAG